MTTQCTAVYEHGCLRPKTPLALAEGTEVQVFILPPSTNTDRRSPAELLAEIAALPTNGGDPNTSRDHDHILYGDQGAR